MAALLEKLNHQASIHQLSVGDLTEGKKYCISLLALTDTKYGRSLKCTLSDPDEGILEVYLPKSIRLNEIEVDKFNQQTKETFLVYSGMRGRAFKISFE